MPARGPGTNVELILARFGHEDAGRRMTLSLAGLPVIAWFWMETCGLARRFEAGHLPPLGVGRSVPLNYLWNPVWIAIYRTFGMTGLHVFFGTLLAGAAGLFAACCGPRPRSLSAWRRRSALLASPGAAAPSARSCDSSPGSCPSRRPR